MNKWSVLLDYDPKCTFYPKRTSKGKVYFYLRYYLPGGKRVSRAAGEKKIEARKLMFEKEQTVGMEFLKISTLSESLIQ